MRANGIRKTFLISPVRGVDPAKYRNIVLSLEADGFSVYWPARDTDQADRVGLKICKKNIAAIAAADFVHIIWDGRSQGCLFDLGVALALNKKVVVIDAPEPTPEKSFQNVMRAWAQESGSDTNTHPSMKVIDF